MSGLGIKFSDLSFGKLYAAGGKVQKSHIQTALAQLDGISTRSASCIEHVASSRQDDRQMMHENGEFETVA